jgi:hypothetical protein
MCRSKMMVQSGAKRHPKDASAASALASTQDRSAGRMTVLGRARSAGVTAADRGRAVPVAALGRQSVVPQGAKAEMPARRWWVSRGRLRPPAERPSIISPVDGGYGFTSRGLASRREGCCRLGRMIHEHATDQPCPEQARRSATRNLWASIAHDQASCAAD